MIRNFFDQPVNFMLSATLIFLFGITLTSLVLDNQELPNPLTALGEAIGLLILASIYGKAAVGAAIAQ